jgi:Galactose oxidase, central domain
MSLFSPRKKHSEDPSTLVPASGLRVASCQVTQQLQFQVPTYSLSPSQSDSPQEKQQSQPVCPWSAHAPPFEQSPSPFLRDAHALSTSATAASGLFLFGGYVHISESPSNDLYVISTRDFSTTLVQTSGDVPSPRFAHDAALTGTTLLIWGGWTDFNDQNAQEQGHDDSLYLLNLGTSDLFDVKTRSS